MTLVAVRLDRCPACAAPVTDHTFAEAALVRHGGYGATRRTLVTVCTRPGCGWHLTRKVTEGRP